MTSTLSEPRLKLQYRLQPGQLLEYHIQVEGEEAGHLTVVDTRLMHCVLESTSELIRLESTMLESSLTCLEEVIPLPLNSGECQMRPDGGWVGETRPSVPYITLPDLEVSVGTSWPGEAWLVLPDGQSRAVAYTCRFQEIARMLDRPVAVLDLECPAQVWEAAGVKQTLRMAGRSFFDYEQGILVHSDFETHNLVESGEHTVQAFNRVSVQLVNSTAPVTGEG